MPPLVLEGKKLEQITTGAGFNNAGKRVDALLKTSGLINSICFVEIKTHLTKLMSSKKPYRSECWQISNELTGAIAQVQKTVSLSLKNLQSKIHTKSKSGELTGEELFIYEPKSYLIIGSLDEFNGEHGVNEDQFSSFEIFRRNLTNPEIITFDELYSRAKYIVKSNEDKSLTKRG